MRPLAPLLILALPYLEAAAQAGPGHALYRQVLDQVRHAHALRKAGDL